MPAGTLTVCVRVLHAHHHRVRNLARSRRPALLTHIADDHSALAEAQLRAVVLADPHTLEQSKRPSQPVDGLTYVWIDQDGDDSRLRDRAVRLQHGGHPTGALACRQHLALLDAADLVTAVWRDREKLHYLNAEPARVRRRRRIYAGATLTPAQTLQVEHSSRAESERPPLALSWSGGKDSALA